MATPRRLLGEIKPGEKIDQVFLIRYKDLRRTMTGDMYAACVLADRSGTAQARWWQVTEEQFQAIPAQGFARVAGRTESYRGALQIVIDRAVPELLDGAALADFLPTTRYDAEQMWQEVLEHLRTIRDPDILRIIAKFVEDDEFVRGFRASPAASQIHHAFIGGLLEHTLGVIRLAVSISPLYPEELNHDLLVAGAFLHDIGKIEELRADVGLSYTERGNLVGHIASAVLWLQEKARIIEEETGEPFPSQTLDLLQHLVLAHHGTNEYGSPKVPMIPEALVLHHIDDLDAKIQVFTKALAEDNDPDAPFTSFVRALNAKVYKKNPPQK